MNRIGNRNTLSFVMLLLAAGSQAPTFAQPPEPIAAGRTVMTFINRLVINPPQVQVFGYFPTIEGLPDPLFSGTPGESTAYFTWTLDAAGAVQIQNGDATVPGTAGIAVLPSGHTLNVYFNENPAQNWSTPASFSAGQLVATFRAGIGAQVGSGPVALVTQSYILTSSNNFTFKGQQYNFAHMMPHGVTFISFGGNIPIGNSNPQVPPLVFSGAGTAIAIGGLLSGLPLFF